MTPHLLVDGHVHRNVIRAQLLSPLGPGHRIGHRDEIHHHMGPIVLARQNTLLNGGVRGRAQNIDDAGPRLGRGLHFHTPRVHDFHVRHNGHAGEMALQFPHRIQSLALDERGAHFEPIHPGRDRLLSHQHGPM